MKAAHEKLSRTSGKVYLVFWICYWAVTLFLFLSNKNALLPADEELTWKNYALFAGVLAFIIFSIVFCFLRWGNCWFPTDENGKKCRKRIRPWGFLIVAAMAVFAFLDLELINNSELLPEMEWKFIWANLLVLFVFGIIWLLWLNSLRRALMGALCFATTMSFIFYFVYECRGEPLQFIDVFSFGTAMTVAGQYEFVYSKWITVTLALTLCLIGILIHTPDYILVRSTKGKIAIRLAALALMAGSFCFYMNTSWERQLGITADLFSPIKTYRQCGTTIGFFDVAKFMKNDPPEGYSVSGTEAIAEQSVSDYAAWDGKSEADGTTPVNIIAIMNEAWADFRYAGDVETNIPYMEFYDSLDENVIKGHTLVCITGGGTAKTEYEFLTSNSVKQYPGLVPYVNFYTHSQYSMVSVLEENGYETIAVHPHKGSNWNRTAAYSYLGFDQFLTVDDFDESYDRIRRDFVTDKANYDKLIELVEEKEDPDDKLFIFNVTMQNHGGYSGTDITNDVKTIGINEANMNEYLSLMKMTDEALEYLIDYFKDCDEPTMIIMFGDHYPTTDEEFDTYLAGAAKDDLPADERVNFYATPFLIWTNYESETKTDVVTSTNFLGSIALHKTGLALSPFEDYVEMLMSEIPAYNHIGYYLPDGSFTAWDDATEEVNEKINEYECLQYNALSETKGRIDWFFKAATE